VTRHIILIGLSGAGKSAAGREMAALLGCPFRDLDDDIVASAGLAVADIFRTHGEPAFRRLERDAMEHAVGTAPHVVAAGGGWAAQPGNLEGVLDVALIVYLRCAPETAAARLGEARDRPLLVPDPATALRAQLRARQASYERAHAVVDTDERSPRDVAEAVVALARRSGGW
jgi:shikimate kinase